MRPPQGVKLAGAEIQKKKNARNLLIFTTTTAAIGKAFTLRETFNTAKPSARHA